MFRTGLRWTAKIIAALLALLVLALLVGLAWASIDIRSTNPALPSIESLLAPREVGAASWNGPLRIRYVNTASQPNPRGLVLAGSLDPNPERPYVMSHVSFVLEWADGRLFLIDAGMPRDDAIAFGKPAEWVGAGATRAHGSVSQQLGADARRVAGIAFTHLHQDHTSGLAQLCSQLEELSVFQAPLQFERGNHTTRTSEQQIADASCARPQRLEGESLFAVPGFPGLFVIQASGHTPGSQLFVAHLPAAHPGGERQTWVFTGDVVNHVDGIRNNIPKPTLYSLLLVPESPERLERVRRFLHTLERNHGVRLLVSHDQLQIESSGIEAW